MDKLYSFYDYENAYYKCQVYRCKEIGCYLLKRLNNKKAKQLYKKLSNLEYKLTWGEEDSKHNRYIAQLLLDVKIWLMVHNC